VTTGPGGKDLSFSACSLGARKLLAVGHYGRATPRSRANPFAAAAPVASWNNSA
jgi:hypothetical protein